MDDSIFETIIEIVNKQNLGEIEGICHITENGKYESEGNDVIRFKNYWSFHSSKETYSEICKKLKEDFPAPIFTCEWSVNINSQKFKKNIKECMGIIFGGSETVNQCDDSLWVRNGSEKCKLKLNSTTIYECFNVRNCGTHDLHGVTVNPGENRRYFTVYAKDCDKVLGYREKLDWELIE